MELIKDKTSGSNFKFFSNPKSQIFNSKFSFPSLKFHILNAQFLHSKSPKFQVVKISNFKFLVQNFKLQIFKIPSFNFSKYQISIQNLKSQKFKFQLNSFQCPIPSFKNQIFFKEPLKTNQSFLDKSEKVEIKKRQMKITDFKKSKGTTKHSSVKD